MFVWRLEPVKLPRARVTHAHDEQDDAEGGRRDWEEDPLGFDTNPGLLRAMCMAFE